MPQMRGGGDCGSLTAEAGGGRPRLDDVTDGIIRPASGLVRASERRPGASKCSNPL